MRRESTECYIAATRRGFLGGKLMYSVVRRLQAWGCSGRLNRGPIHESWQIHVIPPDRRVSDAVYYVVCT